MQSTVERFSALFGDNPSGPVVMVSLLKFKPDGEGEYRRYADPMRVIVEREGGRVIFAGDVIDLLIGEVSELWDMIAIIEYPSIRAFMEIVAMPEVAAISVHRTRGVAGQLLLRVAAHPEGARLTP